MLVLSTLQSCRYAKTEIMMSIEINRRSERQKIVQRLLEEHVSCQERTKSLSRAHKTLYTLSRFLLLTRRIRAREIRRFSTLMCNILICVFLFFCLLSFLTLLISSSIFFFTVLGITVRPSIPSLSRAPSFDTFTPV